LAPLKIFNRPLELDTATAVARSWPELNNVVGSADYCRIMLNNQ
jgi:hypothetical protein